MTSWWSILTNVWRQRRNATYWKSLKMLPYACTYIFVYFKSKRNVNMTKSLPCKGMNLSSLILSARLLSEFGCVEFSCQSYSENENCIWFCAPLYRFSENFCTFGNVFCISQFHINISQKKSRNVLDLESCQFFFQIFFL